MTMFQRFSGYLGSGRWVAPGLYWLGTSGIGDIFLCGGPPTLWQGGCMS